MFRVISKGAAAPDLSYDGRVVLRGIGAIVRLDAEGEAPLACASCETETGEDEFGRYEMSAIAFEDEAEPKRAAVRLRVRCYDRFALVDATAEALRANDFGSRRAFAPDAGVTIRIAEIPDVEGLLANYQHKDWWTRPRFCSAAADAPPRTVSMLWRTGETFYQLLPACGPSYKSDAAGVEGALHVRLSSNQGGMVDCDTFAFVLGAGADPFALAERNAEAALRAIGDPAPLRRDRKYPDVLDTLGWCSWDAFYHAVDEAGLFAKAEELREKGVPVRWAMIDDGWSDVEDRRLRSFDADRTKFPRGLEHTVRGLKERFGIRWVGVWHTIVGYWHGLAPDGEPARAYGRYLFRTNRGNVVPYPDEAVGFGFWNAWHGYLKRQGVDFVKVDSQSAVHNFLRYHRTIGEAASAAHRALEASVDAHFGGAIINCMGMAPENVWHRPRSAVSRSSDDFVPQDADGFAEHAMQNVYNSFYHGPLYWGDWDMFWSEHPDAVRHATLRAVSGGPVYVSDPVGRTNAELLRPLAYRDGVLLRCDGPARPTADALLTDPTKGGAPLKAWNTAGGAGVVAAFHVADGAGPVRGTVGADDVPGLAANGGAVTLYEHFSRTSLTLTALERHAFELAPGECKLFLLVPNVGDVTPIGLADKYISTHAVLSTRTMGRTTFVRLREGGRFAFAADARPAEARVSGRPADVVETSPGLYEIACDGEEGPVEIEIVAGGSI